MLGSQNAGVWSARGRISSSAEKSDFRWRPSHRSQSSLLPSQYLNCVEALTQRIVGQRLVSLDVHTPFLLRTVDPPLSALGGRQVTGVRRVGKRIVISFADDLHALDRAQEAAALFRRSGVRAVLDGDDLRIFEAVVRPERLKADGNVEAEAERLRKEIARAEGMLANEGFVSRARPEVVQRERDSLAEMQASFAKNAERLSEIRAKA